REAHGIAALYAEALPESYASQGGKKSKDKRAPGNFTASSLQTATGDRLYFVGPHRLFPGQEPIAGLTRLPPTTFAWISGKSGTFEFTPPGTHRRYYAVANPIVTGRKADAQVVGAIIVA